MKGRPVGLLVMILSLALFLGDSDRSIADDVEEKARIEQFREHLRVKDFHRSRGILLEIQRKNPTSADLADMELDWGIQLLKTERDFMLDALAKQHLAKFLSDGVYAETPRAPRGRLEYAKILIREQRFQDARTILRDLLETAPNKIVHLAASQLVLLCGLDGEIADLDFCETALGYAVAGLPLIGMGAPCRANCQELLDHIRTIRDPDQGVAHHIERGWRHRDLAVLAGEIEMFAERLYHWDEAGKAMEEALALMPPLGDPGSPSDDLETQLKARLMLAKSKAFLGDPDGARLLVEEIWTRRDDIPSYGRHNLAGEAYMWIIGLDMQEGRNPAEVEDMLVELVGSRTCSPGEYLWAYQQVLRMKRERNDLATQYLLLDEMSAFFGEEHRSKTRFADRHSDLVESLAGQHSRLYRAMDEARIVYTDTNGNPTLESFGAMR